MDPLTEEMCNRIIILEQELQQRNVLPEVFQAYQELHGRITLLEEQVRLLVVNVFALLRDLGVDSPLSGDLYDGLMAEIQPPQEQIYDTVRQSHDTVRQSYDPDEDRFL
jgi:uncharacterized membrane protein